MRLTEAYMALGVVSEAQTAAAVLGHNFPDSRWYADAYRLVKSGGLRAGREQGLLDQPGVQAGRARADAVQPTRLSTPRHGRACPGHPRLYVLGIAA